MRTVLTFHRGEPATILERLLEAAGVADGQQVGVEVSPIEALRSPYPSLRDAAAALLGAAQAAGMAKERARMKKTHMRPATPDGIERLEAESGIDELDMDPPGTERMTLGQWVDEIMERRREAAPCKR